jgi:putative glutamine amidotransferase
VTAACDGLLVLGGGDIDATVAGHTEPAVNSYGVDRRADEDSLAAIHAAVDAERPVLGLCRGAQLVNVAFGGTIVPDLSDFVLHRGGPGEPLFIDEPVTVLGGTRLAQLLGEGTVVGRTGHHQAVDRVAPDLRVAARALDGVVEGVEHPDRWVLGVQWHPEDPAGSASDRRRLFGGFLQACAAAPASTPS